MEMTEATLERAGKLVKDLGKERTRWNKTCKEINERVKNIPKSSLLAAAHIGLLSLSIID